MPLYVKNGYQKSSSLIVKQTRITRVWSSSIQPLFICVTVCITIRYTFK